MDLRQALEFDPVGDALAQFGETLLGFLVSDDFVDLYQDVSSLVCFTTVAASLPRLSSNRRM